MLHFITKSQEKQIDHRKRVILCKTATNMSVLKKWNLTCRIFFSLNVKYKIILNIALYPYLYEQKARFMIPHFSLFSIFIYGVGHHYHFE